MDLKSAGVSALRLLLLLSLMAPTGVFAQASSTPPRFSPEELDQMLAPIALYPDALLAQILIAATYPVEVVEAERWLKANRNVKRDQLNAAVDQMKWDLCVKALLPFPPILAMMSDKLDWTLKVGDAFLAQQDEVMDHLQQLRSKAYTQGNLKTTKEQKVLVEQQIIRIEPANPRVVYLPSYNPTVIYGSWWYPSHPPNQWRATGSAAATGLLSFAAGVAVGASWNSGWGSWNWGAHQVNGNINRTANINQNVLNVSNVQTSKWQHDSARRQGVPYRSGDLRSQYQQAGSGGSAGRSDFRGYDEKTKDNLSRGSTRQGLGQAKEADAFDRQKRDPFMGFRQPTSSGSQRVGAAGAFEGLGRGDDTQLFSDRGRTSRRNTEGIRTGGVTSPGATVGRELFGSPEEAVKGLVDAIKANDPKRLLVLFGVDAKSLVSSGDAEADRAGRELFVKAQEEMNQLEKKDENRVILHVGVEDWPFPIPIVKRSNGWYFNASEGREEILNRRVGRNELCAMRVCLATADAQREYASQDHDGDGILEYANKFLSDPGKKNGLYWPVAEGDEPSPLGLLVAMASGEGHGKKAGRTGPEPFHGYWYRILTAQGKSAPGGARDYLMKDRMIGGFAVMAYPAEYGKSGVMTFIANQDGVVYEKDLGSKTTQTARGVKRYDPDETWRKVE